MITQDYINYDLNELKFYYQKIKEIQKEIDELSKKLEIHITKVGNIKPPIVPEGDI